MNTSHESPDLVSNLTVFKPATSYTSLSFYSINVILGLPVHSYVLWLICTGKGSGAVAEFFTLNLTVCEILFCLCNVLIVADLIKFLQRFTTTLSYAAYFSMALPTTGRPLFHCVICIERYLAVLHPIFFLKFKPLRYRITCSAIIWLILPMFGQFCLFTLLSNNIDLFIYVYLSFYFILFLIKLFSYISLFRALRFPKPGEKGRESREVYDKKRKAMKHVLVITITMAAQYGLFALVGSLSGALSVAVYEVLWHFQSALIMLLAYVNPLLYIYKTGKH